MTMDAIEWEPLLSGNETSTVEQLEFLYQRQTTLPVGALPTTLERFLELKPQIEFQTRPHIDAFVEEALEHMAPEEAHQFRRQLPHAGAEFPPSLLQSITAEVVKWIDEPFILAVNARFIEIVLGQAMTAFAQAVNASKAKKPGKTVVFVARNCFNLLQREALYLKKHGYNTFLINLNRLNDELRPAFQNSFDIVFDGISYYPALGKLLDQIDPDYYHVQCWMWEYLLARFISENKKSAYLICEFYDITSVYAQQDVQKRVFWDQRVDLDFAMERYIFQHADGVVHRFPSPLIDKLTRHHGGNAPHIEMHQYVCPEYATYGKGSEVTARRLVYIGGFIPRTAEHPPELFPEWGHAEAWRSLLEQGFEIDLYSSMFRGYNEPGLDAVRALAQEFPTFRLRPGIAQDRLSQTLSQYDFGLILADMSRETSWCNSDQFDYAVGTKLFSYLEAGLPVIVNAEYTYMTDILESHGLGFGLHSRDLSQAKERIQSFDNPRARQRIIEFNDAHGMDTEIERLISLYDRVRT